MNKKVIHTVIDHNASLLGKKIVIEELQQKISYENLVLYSNRIANTLLEVGLQKGEVVGVYLQNGINYVATILGINKAGGIFMPLEVAYPVKRTEYILEKVKPNLIVTDDDKLEKISVLCKDTSAKETLKNFVVVSAFDKTIEYKILDEGNIVESREGIWNDNPVLVVVDGEDSNYLLYTSGSTGQPKIIEGCHKSLSHFVHWEKGEFGLDENIRISQLAPLSFDVSLRDIFVPLLCGGTLCIPDKNTKLDPVKLLEWVGSSQVNLIHTVPSIFRLVTQALQSDKSLLKNVQQLKFILLAGEALYGRDVISWREVAGEEAELVNLYGPSETTLAKLFYRIKDINDPSSIVPLGNPIANTAAVIISYGQLCSIGAIGEIYIKTPFRSKGYYKDDAQTKEKFVQNPFNNDYDDILYKTGDLGRYLENKAIEFIGREDGQIKIRGNRVELTEIEKVVMNYPGIKQVIVVPISKNEGESLLTCYYTVESPVDEDLISTHISTYLPEYMFPSYYVQMEEFPLNLNGKIDKRALPRPEELLYEKLNYEAPANELEEKIATIWADILGLKRVGVLNSFFELGGHSLTATRVVSKIYQDLEKQVSLKDFFDHPTVRSLSVLLNSKAQTAYKAIEPLSKQEHYQVSHSQKRLWVTEQLYGSLHYHMLGGCYINMAININAFNKVFDTIVERHESLRTTFLDIDGVPRQKIHPPEDFNFKLDFHDLEQDPSKEQKAQALINEEQNTPFDLRHGPLFRSKLIKLEEDKFLFLFNMHHIISDGWSSSVLIKEILVLYESYNRGEENPLTPLRIQYKDFSAWQNNIIKNSTTIDYQSYWHEKLAGEIPILNLPTDFSRPEIKTYEGSNYSFTLSKEISESIRRLCIENETSLFMFMLSVINLELYILSDDKDIIIGSPVAGRNHPELENQIGFYLNNIILRNKIQRSSSFMEFLLQVKQTTLDAFDHQDYPYDLLIEELKPNTSNGRNPFYDVLLVMNNEGLNGDKSEMSQLEKVLNIGHLQMEADTSKLDLSFFIDDASEICINIEYSVELFKLQRIQKMAEDFVKLVTVILENRNVNIGELKWTFAKSNKEEWLKPTMDEIGDDF